MARSSQGGAVEKERIPLLGLVTAVPHANEIEGAGEHARLKQTQEEAGGQQSAVTLNKPLHHGGEAKEEHVDGEPDMGAELFQEDVGRNFEDAVRNEKDDQSRVELVAVRAEVQVLGKVEDVGVGDVDAIWRGIVSCLVHVIRNHVMSAITYRGTRGGT